MEKALANLRNEKSLSAAKILSIQEDKLANLVRPAGYFNQKARKLKIFSRYYASLRGKTPARESLLSLWGIGPETADSMLLYSYKQPEFVVDAYTRRLLVKNRIIKEKATYNEIKGLFEKNLPKDYKLFQEYHALIVEEGKQAIS